MRQEGSVLVVKLPFRESSGGFPRAASINPPGVGWTVQEMNKVLGERTEEGGIRL